VPVYAGVMDSDLLEVANTYTRHYKQRSDDDFWAWQEVQRMIKTDLTQGWSIVQLLLEKADSQEMLGYIAAGPLEDFVDIYGDAALDRIENASGTDERMQFALSGIWLERESPVLMRWRALMQKYGFMGGTREPLSKHPDCWF